MELRVLFSGARAEFVEAAQRAIRILLVGNQKGADLSAPF